MKRAVLLLVAACQAGPDDYGVGPGGRGGPTGQGSGSAVDAGVGDGGAGDGDGGVKLTGRVCLLSDLRKPTLCDARQNAAGLRVSLGSSTTTTTDAAGAFTIIAPLGAGFTWRVTGVNLIIPSLMPFGTDNTIPAISIAAYEALLASNNVPFGDQEGSVVVRVVSGTAAVANVRASTIDPDRPTFYDGLDADIWDPTATQTGSSGVVWFPGVSTTLSPATITLTPQVGAAVTTAVAFENRWITFVTRSLP